MTTLFEKPVLGDEYSPKKNAPLIFMPVTLIAVIFGICGIIANLIVLIDGTDGTRMLHSNCDIRTTLDYFIIST
jgi:hypothetical protein